MEMPAPAVRLLKVHTYYMICTATFICVKMNTTQVIIRLSPVRTREAMHVKGLIPEEKCTHTHYRHVIRHKNNRGDVDHPTDRRHRSQVSEKKPCALSTSTNTSLNFPFCV